jgi:hypothetical protein
MTFHRTTVHTTTQVAELLERLSAAEDLVGSIPGTALSQAEQEAQLAELNGLLQEKEDCIVALRKHLQQQQQDQQQQQQQQQQQ